MSLLSDVKRLEERPSSEVRGAIAEKVTTYLNSDVFDDNEKQVAYEIIRLLMADVEMRVRSVLSENLKNNSAIPHDVATTLANDVLEVALPMLEFSKVLNDDDLLAIIRSTEEIARLNAISRREDLSAMVSQELIKTQNEEVVVSLFKNKSANIPDQHLMRVVDDFIVNQNNTSIVESLIFRGGLSIGIVEKLVHHTSGELQKRLTDEYNLDANIAEKTADASREQATLGLLNQKNPQPQIQPQQQSQPQLTFSQPQSPVHEAGAVASSDEPKPVEHVAGQVSSLDTEVRKDTEYNSTLSVQKMSTSDNASSSAEHGHIPPQMTAANKPVYDLVDHLYKNERLTHSIILRALCEGKLVFFEAGLGKLAGIPAANAHTLVWSNNEEALRSLYHKAGMPGSALEAVEIVARIVRDEISTNGGVDETFKERLIDAITGEGYDRSVPLMPYMLALIGSRLGTNDVLI